MRMYDIIKTKRDGGVLSKEQIDYFVKEYTNGMIPDYQVAALLMAVYFQGMNEAETLALTLAMAESGDCLSLSAIHGVTADKHSPAVWATRRPWYSHRWRQCWALKWQK